VVYHDPGEEGLERMDEILRVAWDETMRDYDFGPGHPLAPVRLELAMALTGQFGVFDAPGVRLAGFPPAGDDLLRLVHDADYLHAVQDIALGGFVDPRRFGLGTPDNPVFPDMHGAAAQHGANMGGGLHHAMRARASGFCVYNDPAIAIAKMLADGAGRVAYVDVDAHHGDGVQAAFYDDPRVLTISLHEHPSTLFPGTGLASESGGPNAQGRRVNVALPAGTGDEDWLRAFEAIVPPLLAAFSPEVPVTQHGCDSHALDPLSNLMLSVDGQLAAARTLHRLAHEHASGRWILLGGGGYALADVVPRIRAHVLAEAAHQPIDPLTETPEAWRRLVPARRAVFPYHGLDSAR
jgi:acetoin utilization protein AcuC